MMRKGDLREYSVEWVLRAAAEERLSGGIEFHAAAVTCVHLDDGHVYLASAEGDEVPGLDDDLDDAAVAVEEERRRAETVAVVRDLLTVDEGWYFFHPLHDHPLRGEWRWEVDAVLTEARPRPSVVPPLGEPTGAPTPTLDGAPPAAPGSSASDPDPAGPGSSSDVGAAPDVRSAPAAPSRPLTDDEWAVVQTLVGAADRAELAGRLGWDEPRLEAVVAGLVGPPPGAADEVGGSAPNVPTAPAVPPSPPPPAPPVAAPARPSPFARRRDDADTRAADTRTSDTRAADARVADDGPGDDSGADDGVGRSLTRRLLRSPRSAG